jgi:PPM family protein phosphatase
MIFFKYTIKGSRKTNEDSFYSIESKNRIYACIADGVGGLNHGEFASKFVVSEFEKYCAQNQNPDLVQFLNTVNQSLIENAKNQFNTDHVATTFTAGIITFTSIQGVHIGDSRVCILRGNGIKQLTEDHTELGRLIREGKFDAKDKKYYVRKNVIESVVGSTSNFKIQSFKFDLMGGDRILFSTDGFHEVITKEEIRDISLKYKSLDEFGRQLIIELESRILHDNATFICAEV